MTKRGGRSTSGRGQRDGPGTCGPGPDPAAKWLYNKRHATTTISDVRGAGTAGAGADERTSRRAAGRHRDHRRHPDRRHRPGSSAERGGHRRGRPYQGRRAGVARDGAVRRDDRRCHGPVHRAGLLRHQRPSLALRRHQRPLRDPGALQRPPGRHRPRSRADPVVARHHHRARQLRRAAGAGAGARADPSRRSGGLAHPGRREHRRLGRALLHLVQPDSRARPDAVPGTDERPGVAGRRRGSGGPVARGAARGHRGVSRQGPRFHQVRRHRAFCSSRLHRLLA